VARPAIGQRARLTLMRDPYAVGAYLSGSIAAVCLAGCSLMPWLPREIGLTYPELNERLNRRFPVERNIADLIRVTLLRPLVTPASDTSPGEASRLAIAVDLDVKLPSLLNSTQRTLWGTMRLSGVPRFDLRSQSILLQDARIDRVRVDNMPDALSAALSRTASQLAKEYFEERPLYTLTAQQAERLRVGASAAQVEVRENRLVLVLN